MANTQKSTEAVMDLLRPDTGADGFCRICYDPFMTESSVRTSCNHLFGQDDIVRWLRDNPTCPFCREELWQEEPLTAGQLRDLFFDVITEDSHSFERWYDVFRKDRLLHRSQFSREDFWGRVASDREPLSIREWRYDMEAEFHLLLDGMCYAPWMLSLPLNQQDLAVIVADMEGLLLNEGENRYMYVGEFLEQALYVLEGKLQGEPLTYAAMCLLYFLLRWMRLR